jgi:hypothetical protein
MSAAVYAPTTNLHYFVLFVYVLFPQQRMHQRRTRANSNQCMHVRVLIQISVYNSNDAKIIMLQVTYRYFRSSGCASAARVIMPPIECPIRVGGGLVGSVWAFG